MILITGSLQLTDEASMEARMDAWRTFVLDLKPRLLDSDGAGPLRLGFVFHPRVVLDLPNEENFLLMIENYPAPSEYTARQMLNILTLAFNGTHFPDFKAMCIMKGEEGSHVVSP